MPVTQFVRLIADPVATLRQRFQVTVPTTSGDEAHRFARWLVASGEILLVQAILRPPLVVLLSGTLTRADAEALVAALTLPDSVGGTVSASGAGFLPNSTITISFAVTSGTTTPSPCTTDGSGNFTCTFTIPGNAAIGPNTVTATDGARDASATFTVDQLY